jgi:hypothetical protein
MKFYALAQYTCVCVLLQQLTKQISECIEQELHQRAASAGNEFRILSSGEGTSQPSTSKGGTKKASNK